MRVTCLGPSMFHEPTVTHTPPRTRSPMQSDAGDVVLDLRRTAADRHAHCLWPAGLYDRRRPCRMGLRHSATDRHTRSESLTTSDCLLLLARSQPINTRRPWNSRLEQAAGARVSSLLPPGPWDIDNIDEDALAYLAETFVADAWHPTIGTVEFRREVVAQALPLNRLRGNTGCARTVFGDWRILCRVYFGLSER